MPVLHTLAGFSSVSGFDASQGTVFTPSFQFCGVAYEAIDAGAIHSHVQAGVFKRTDLIEMNTLSF